jgi:hypothetical protein
MFYGADGLGYSLFQDGQWVNKGIIDYQSKKFHNFSLKNFALWNICPTMK